MAKLLAYHTLPPVTDQFLGFAKDAQDDRIICTYGRNHILLLEVRPNSFSRKRFKINNFFCSFNIHDHRHQQENRSKAGIQKRGLQNV